MSHKVIHFKAMVLTGLLCTASAAMAAAPTITTTSGTTPFAVSNTDLLQTSLGSAPVAVGLFTGYDTGGETVLRNGNAGGTGATDYQGTALITSDSMLTYTLDLGVSPLGYNITSIETFGAWDDGRDQQKISIAYATVAAPNAFVTLAAYDFDPIGNFSRVKVSPGTGNAFLMENVYAIRFSFPDQENSAGGYRELDVFGVSAVPEPETYAMLLAGLGLMGAIARRRKNKA